MIVELILLTVIVLLAHYIYKKQSKYMSESRSKVNDTGPNLTPFVSGLDEDYIKQYSELDNVNKVLDRPRSETNPHIENVKPWGHTISD